MDKTALLALAERVEGLLGPDREVDALIVAHCTIKDLTKLAVWNTPEKWAAVSIKENWNVTRFTASLDSAMTLTTGLDRRIGAGAGLMREAMDRLSKQFALHITFWPDNQDYREWLARFLTAAALRARANQ